MRINVIFKINAQGMVADVKARAPHTPSLAAEVKSYLNATGIFWSRNSKW